MTREMTREEAKVFIAQSVRSDIDIAMVAAAIKAIEQDPKSGRWITDGLNRKYTWMCSRCHDHYRAMYDYCPSCGMKMEGEEQA